MKTLAHFKDYLLFVLCSVIFSVFLNAQNPYETNTKSIDSLLSIQEFKKADSLLRKYINNLKQKQAYLELTECIYYVGKFALAKKDKAIAIKETVNFAESITYATNSLSIARQKHIELSRFYGYLNSYQKSIEENFLALDITQKMPEATGDFFGIIHHNLSISFRRLGRLKESTWHSRKSLNYYLSYPNSDKTKILDAYNSLGGRMWDAYKIDSALFYFKKAEDIIAKLDPTPKNKYYYAASNQANMASIYSTIGNTKESLKYNEKSIKNYLNFLKANTDGKDFFKEEARLFLNIAIENYAADYSQLGNFKKAKELNTFSLEEKKKYLAKDDPEIAFTSLQVANSYIKLKEFETAEKFINQSLDIYTNREQKDYLSLADSYYYKGVVYESYGNTELAKEYFEKSKGYYKQVFGDTYDPFYLSSMITFSAFYAKSGYTEKAIEMATTTYNYVVLNQGKSTVLEYSQLLNLANIHYKSENYTEASEHIKKALALLNSSYAAEASQLNASEKPMALLLQSKIELEIVQVKDIAFLQSQFTRLKEAIHILEQQKIMAIANQNISIILYDNDEVFELAKGLAMMLYDETRDENYLKEILSIHESKLYNKIRQQLNIQSDFTLDAIPEALIEEENALKLELNSTLNTRADMELFFKTNENWSAFLETLKRDYPKYYNLRYASISKTLNINASNFDDTVSVVRYVFIQEKLYVFVLEKNRINVYALDHKALNSELSTKKIDNYISETNLEYTGNLYDLLWKPFENGITNKNIVIIPDGNLFNLSFEVLTTTKVNSFKELAEKSLLSKYNMSYNYSLLLIDKSFTPRFFENNFVAFTPEFNDQMKNNYRVAITDSVLLDKSYLKLLPQPFTVDLAKAYSQLFDGSSFINEKASKQVFTEEAKEHKIIHIGTHAESNNISPEFSRLIFAKNIEDSENTDNNSLYTYEIYNQNLASNLAILTACETGKPSFQPGEGMISLAHAFNYAGSESILTSLWKIDEQASAQILDNFYKHLQNKKPKHEALRLAKLDYLEASEGRLLAPQYWAGLVLIGDTSPIVFQTTSLWQWAIGIALVITIIILVRRKLS